MRSVVQIKIEDVWPGDVLEMEQGFRRRVIDVKPTPTGAFDVDLVLRERDEYVTRSSFNWDETVWVVR